MSCLDNLIGVRGKCEADTPSSGLYVQDLVGMTIANADASITEERQSGIQLIQDKINFAIEAVKHEVYNQLSPYWRANSLIDQDTVGYYKDNLPSLATEAGYYRGQSIKLDGKYVSVFISTVRLQMAVAGTVSFKIYDLLTGLEVHTFDIVTTSNNEIGEAVVNKTFTSTGGRLRLFIGYPSTVASFENSMSGKWGCYGCGDWGRYSCATNPRPSFSGSKIATGSSKVQSNILSSNTGNGISITYSIQCDMGQYLCTMANLLAWPILHKTALEILRETLYSKRLNSVVTLYGKDTAELIAYYEGEYKNSLSNIFNNMRTPTDSCFQCKERVRWKTQIP